MIRGLLKELASVPYTFPPPDVSVLPIYLTFWGTFPWISCGRWSTVSFLKTSDFHLLLVKIFCCPEKMRQNMFVALTHPFLAHPSCPLAFASSWVHPPRMTALHTASSPHSSLASGHLISFFCLLLLSYKALSKHSTPGST